MYISAICRRFFSPMAPIYLEVPLTAFSQLLWIEPRYRDGMRPEKAGSGGMR